MKRIIELVREAHQNAVRKGWWEEERSFGEIIALVHSEVSEALEDYRKGNNPANLWYDRRLPDGGIQTVLKMEYSTDKPCGIPSELADICIRIFDIAGKYNWGPILEAVTADSVENCFWVEMKYNSLPEHLTSIHFDLSQAWINYERGGEQGAIRCLAHVLNSIKFISTKFKIDLDRAIDEKMVYNATRPHRHGGKVL